MKQNREEYQKLGVKYNWEGIEFPAQPRDWEKFEQNNKTIALNIFFVPYNTETIRSAYRSKYNHKRKNQIILLMIIDGNKRHYIAVSSFSALLKGKSSNHNGDFYCLNCFNSYTTKTKLEEHEEICNKHDSCCIEMPKWFEKMLKYNPGQKSLKAPFIVYHREKKLSMSVLAGQCLQNVYLKKKKINLIITEEKIVLKNCVKS